MLGSAAVFRIGFGAREVVRKLGADPELLKHHFPFLWEFTLSKEVEICDEVRMAKEMRGEERVNEYVCEGCGREVLFRQSLRKCAGECPRDLKPRYCNPGCQQSVSGHLPL